MNKYILMAVLLFVALVGLSFLPILSTASPVPQPVPQVTAGDCGYDSCPYCNHDPILPPGGPYCDPITQLTDDDCVKKCVQEFNEAIEAAKKAKCKDWHIAMKAYWAKFDIIIAEYDQCMKDANGDFWKEVACENEKLRKYRKLKLDSAITLDSIRGWFRLDVSIAEGKFKYCVKGCCKDCTDCHDEIIW